MSEPYSPNLFLFQSYVGEVLKESKKILKIAPFQSIDPDTLLNNSKNQHMDQYHQYFLAAMGHLRTRQLACSNYEKLIRQALIDRDHLPPSLISSVLAACAGAGQVGGSTSGSSSLGSTSLASTPQGHALYIGNMIKTMLLNTCQPSGQLIQGLNYLLEGTRKKYPLLYNAMLEEVYNGLLVRYREQPLKIFMKNYTDMLVDEVQAHIDSPQYAFATRKLDTQTGKADMAIYKQENGFGKFGKCFSCRKEAAHYLKEQWLPICGLGCKQKVKGLLSQCQSGQPFTLMAWLLDNLHSGDEAILTFLYRELQYSLDKHNLQSRQIVHILQILIHQIGSSNMSKPLVGIITLLMTKWQSLIPQTEVSHELSHQFQHYFKVYLLQVLTIIQQVPISKEYLDYILFLAEVLRNDEILVRLFVNYDSKFFQAPILARMFNLISQYAKKFEAPLQGLANIVRSLMNRFVQMKVRDDHWKGYGQFLKKRELTKIITAFNKKPINGIKMLQKLFDTGEEPISDSAIPDLDKPQKERFPPIEVKIEPERQEIEGQSSQNSGVESPRIEIKNKTENKELKQVQQGFTVMEEEMFDSDLIMSKRIGQLMEEHPSQKLIENQNQRQQLQKVQAPPEHHISLIPPKDFLEEKGELIKEISKKQSLANEKQTEKENMVLSPKKIKGLTPREIALFIRQNLQITSWAHYDGKVPIPISLLSKTKVGEYFGMDNELARKISMEFLNGFNFQKNEIDDVMRIVTNCYSLPKETQQIERIIGDLSLRLLGKYELLDDTSSYQYIYLLMMVQTTNHNPNMKENQKISLETHLSMCKHVRGGVKKERAEADYKRIISNSLNVKMKYPEESIFYDKYAPGQSLRQELYQQEQGCLTRVILLYLWEYLIIGLVLPGNNLGLFETTVLFGRQGLEGEQKGFFQALKKCPPEVSEPQLLKIAIQYGNDLIGKPWDTIVSLLYSLEQTNDCSAVLDRLFTNSGQITPPRMRDILQSLLEFSSSQFRKDTHYTRQLFVLRHINSLIEYNVNRFDVLAPTCWPLLRSYFRDICLHPRKEISMSAVDSLKQLSLKLVKLRMEVVPHDALLQTFLYIFERSGVQMRDLIANVLLNLITSDLRGGWESIYKILDVLDTRDNRLVVKLIGRLVGQVGLNRLGNLPRLHTICIKQLRICGDQVVIEQLLSQLWDLSSFIDESNTWLETIRSIKDIFKISLNPEIMNIFIRLANKCISGVEAARPEGIRSLDRQVLAEVMDVLLFLLQLRGSSKTSALIASLDAISTLNIDFLFKHLVGNCGLLQIFRMFLGGEQKIVFVLFFKKLVREVLIPNIKNGQNDIHLQYLSYWCVNEYMNYLPIQMLNLKDKDKDFEQTLSELLSGPEVTEGEKNHVLIQFHLSNRDNYQKSLVHLIFLDIIESIYKRLASSTLPKIVQLKEKLQTALKQSFDCAFRVNRLILLRNFLWNNGFLTGRMLPGLLKQEHRTLVISVGLFSFAKAYQMMKLYIQTFKETLVNLNKLKELYKATKMEQKEKKNTKEEEEKKQQGKGLVVYANDAALWIQQSELGICKCLQILKKQLMKQQKESFMSRSEMQYLIKLFLSIMELDNLPTPVCQEISSVLHSLYSLAL